MNDDPLKSRNPDLSSFSQRVDLYIKNKNHIIDVLQEENERLRQQLAQHAAGATQAPSPTAAGAPASPSPELLAELQQLRQQVQQQQEELRRGFQEHQQAADLRAGLERAEKQLAELQSQRDQAQQQIAELKRRREEELAAAARQQARAAETAALESRLSELEQQLSKALKENTNLASEKERLQQELDEANAKDPVPPEIVREMQTLARDNSMLRDSLKQAEETARAHALDAAQVESLRTEKAALAAQLVEERRRAADLEKQAQTATARAQELAKAAAMAASMVKPGSSGEFSSTSEESHTLRKQMREWKDQAEAAQQKVRVLEEREQQLQHKSEELQARLDALQQEFDHEKATIANAVSQFEAMQSENQTLRERLASYSQGSTRLQEEVKRHQQTAAAAREETENLHQVIVGLEEAIKERDNEIQRLQGESENWRTAHELALKEIEEIRKANLPLYEAKQQLDAMIERERLMTAKIETLQQQRQMLEGQLSRIFFGPPPAIKRLMDTDTTAASADAVPEIQAFEVHLPFCFPDRLPMPMRMSWQRLPEAYQQKAREEGRYAFRVIRPVRFSRTFLHLALMAPSSISPQTQTLPVLPPRIPRMHPVLTFNADLQPLHFSDVSFDVRSPHLTRLLIVRRAEPDIHPEAGPRPRFRPVAYSFQMFLQSLEKALFAEYHEECRRLQGRVPLTILARGPVTRGGFFRALEPKRPAILPLISGIKPSPKRLHLYRIPFEMQIPRNRINMLLKGIEQTLSALTSHLDQNTPATADRTGTPTTKPRPEEDA